MIRSTIGLILLIISCLVHSSLYTTETIPLWQTQRLIIYLILGFFLLGLEGLTGLMVYYGLNPIYHAVVFYVPILVLVTLMNLEILKNLSIKLRKEGFEALMYAIVLNILIYNIHTVLSREIIAVCSVIITVFCLWIVLILWKYSKDVSKLVDFIDLSESAKAFTFACMLLGCASVVLDLEIEKGNVFLIPPGVAFAVALLLLAKEIYVKYLKPVGKI